MPLLGGSESLSPTTPGLARTNHYCHLLALSTYKTRPIFQKEKKKDEAIMMKGRKDFNNTQEGVSLPFQLFHLGKIKLRNNEGSRLEAVWAKIEQSFDNLAISKSVLREMEDSFRRLFGDPCSRESTTLGLVPLLEFQVKELNIQGLAISATLEGPFLSQAGSATLDPRPLLPGIT